MKKRMAAEWEPAKGVLVAWPPLLPKGLFRELNRDTVMYVMVLDAEVEENARETFARWELDLSRIHFIHTPSRNGKSKYGPYWVRDWGPCAIFNENRSMKLVSGRFCSTPAVKYEHPTILLEVDGAAEGSVRTPLDKPTGPETYMPGSIAEYFGQPNEVFGFAFIGGNVLTDGLDMLISSKILLEENRQMNQTAPEEYYEKVAAATGMNTYVVTDVYEDFGIQHVDCVMKLLDEETILVAQPPKDHPYYDRLERMIDNTLSEMRNYYGKPYRIVRYETNRYSGDELAAYSNSLILNRVVYMPMFGIPEDQKALERWAELMPGYTIKGFEFVVADEPETKEGMFYPVIGWDAADALHCRTRAVWDPDMLFISLDKVPLTVGTGAQTITAIITDYSGKGIVPDSEKLVWRVSGKTEWNEAALRPSSVHERYIGEIKGMEAGKTIEYFVRAKSFSGAEECRPATAPKGFYTYTIQKNCTGDDKQ